MWLVCVHVCYGQEYVHVYENQLHGTLFKFVIKMHEKSLCFRSETS